MDFSTMPSDPMNSWWPYIVSILVGIVTCIRNYMGGIQCPSTNRMDGKLIVVTGANTGIGLETVKELANRGGHVVMCCRNLSRGLEAANSIRAKNPKVKLTVKRLDLSSEKSVRHFASALDGFKIDILINNAGVTLHPFLVTEEGHDIHMATNYFGHFLLTHLLMPNLKMSDQGRVINVCSPVCRPEHSPLSCEPEKSSYSSKEWFRQSKYALILMTLYFAKLIEGTKITINALNPGMVRGTRHNRHSFVMNRWSVRLSLSPWMWMLMKSPQQGAQTSIFLAMDPLIASTSGKFYNDCAEELLPGNFDDPNEAKMLYEKTCKLLNIPEYKTSIE